MEESARRLSDPGSAVGDRHERSLPSATSARQSVAYEGCDAICARGRTFRCVLRRLVSFFQPLMQICRRSNRSGSIPS